MKYRTALIMWIAFLASAPAVTGAAVIGESTRNGSLGKQDCEARTKLLASQPRSLQPAKQKVDAKTLR